MNSYSRKKAFGEQVLSLRIIIISILLIDMHVEDIILTVDGS
ncbi:hypothetical protein [Dyadobacter aurulentus]|nr:hypothetical protein [Dyadobacter sp. UC 10]